MKTYTVIGSRAVRGHQPGETFEEDIPESQAHRLIRSGALGEVAAKGGESKGSGKQSPAKTTESADAGEASDASGDNDTKE